jgi:hypothetical protein
MNIRVTHWRILLHFIWWSVCFKQGLVECLRPFVRFLQAGLVLPRFERLCATLSTSRTFKFV